MLTTKHIVVTMDRLVTPFNHCMLMYFIFYVEFSNEVKYVQTQSWHFEKFLSCYEGYRRTNVKT